MKTLKIETGENNAVLRNKSVEVKKFDSGLKKLAKTMKETMVKASGLGLAAPQVAENIRLIIVTLGFKTDSERILAMVNPRILEYSGDFEVGEEGCLSLPGIWDKVERHHSIVVEFFDVEGARQVMELESLDARVVQHEMDHLDGVLFTDRVRELKEKGLVL